MLLGRLEALLAGGELASVLDGYRRRAGRCDLDPDVIAFVLLRRNLEDLVDWLQSVLEGARPEAQREADLDGVRWCQARWSELDERVRAVRAMLARRP